MSAGIEQDKMNTLQKKLNEINKNILNIQVKNKNLHPLSTRQKDASLSTDNSFIIDTNSSQHVECSLCFLSMPLRSMRSHLSNSCPEKIVTCAEIGCNEKFSLSEKQNHLRNYCQVVKNRNEMILKSAKRKELEAKLAAEESRNRKNTRPVSEEQRSMTTAGSDDWMSWENDSNIQDKLEPHTETQIVHQTITHELCEMCKESVLIKEMHSHCKSACRMRLVFCRNRRFGCLDEIPYKQMRSHLSNICNTEQTKRLLIERSYHRKEMVPCPLCGQLIVLCELAYHEEEECQSRQVPCRNSHLGCEVMVCFSILQLLLLYFCFFFFS